MKIDELELPEVESVKVAKVGPTDVIVIESDQHLTSEWAAQIQSALESVWPGRKIVVLDQGLKLKIARDIEGVD